MQSDVILKLFGRTCQMNLRSEYTAFLCLLVAVFCCMPQVLLSQEAGRSGRDAAHDAKPPAGLYQ
jgi:hypothetical protein